MVKVSRNRQRGKELEKEIANIMGGKRMGLFGGEDIYHPKYSIECKSRKAFIGKKWFKQCEKNNTDNKIPLVIVKVAHDKFEDSLVLMKLSDFMNHENIQ